MRHCDTPGLPEELFVIVSIKLILWVIAPAVPLMMIVLFPVEVSGATLMTNWDETDPSEGMLRGLGVKLEPVTLGGRDVTASDT